MRGCSLFVLVMLVLSVLCLHVWGEVRVRGFASRIRALDPDAWRAMGSPVGINDLRRGTPIRDPDRLFDQLRNSDAIEVIRGFAEWHAQYLVIYGRTVWVVCLVALVCGLADFGILPDR